MGRWICWADETTAMVMLEFRNCSHFDTPVVEDGVSGIPGSTGELNLHCPFGLFFSH